MKLRMCHLRRIRHLAVMEVCHNQDRVPEGLRKGIAYRLELDRVYKLFLAWVKHGELGGNFEDSIRGLAEMIESRWPRNGADEMCAVTMLARAGIHGCYLGKT